MKLTIIIPVYNEIKTIKNLLDKVLATTVNKQIIVIDDYSDDGTRNILLKYFETKIDKLILHSENKGKGAAIQSAQKYVNGDYIIIQDADLEYDPNHYKYFLDELKKNKNIKVLYGSRVLKKNKFSNIQNFSHKLRVYGNIFLTFISNIINNQNLTDAHTCFKIVEKNIFLSLKLKENRFAFCPEITTKIANMKIAIKEVPINYNGRTYDEGKKIRAIDGIWAILALIRYKFFDK